MERLRNNITRNSDEFLKDPHHKTWRNNGKDSVVHLDEYEEKGICKTHKESLSKYFIFDSESNSLDMYGPLVLEPEDVEYLNSL